MTKRETYEQKTEQLLLPIMEEHQFEGITEADRKQVWGMFADNDQQVNGESLFLQYYNQVIHFSGEHRMDDRVIEDVLVPLIYRCVAK